MLTCLVQNLSFCLCRAEDDAEMQDEAAGAAADETDGGAIFSGAGTAPASEAAAIDVGAPSAPGASTKSVDLTYTAADEERRQRLRQVSSLHQFSEGGEDLECCSEPSLDWSVELCASASRHTLWQALTQVAQGVAAEICLAALLLVARLALARRGRVHKACMSACA